MDKDVREIFAQFNISGKLVEYQKVETGHINDSYYLKTDDSNHSGYFLQWINSYIFKDVPGLMNNIWLVTHHLSNKKTENQSLTFKVLEIIPALDGKMYLQDAKGEYWRLYTYIDKMHSYDVVENARIAYEGGKGFGLFMSLLADLPANQLVEIIPGFHNMQLRLDAFEKSLANNKAGRASDVAEEIAFVHNRAAEMLTIPHLIASGDLPLRITHNDTKFNNILFDTNNRASCIVDLDTVMPGSILFDFGDAIRTGANTAEEDEQDLNKVDINLPIYEGYTRGFIESTIHTLTETEISKLAFSARFMTFIIGLRFLTDYLDGDLYFRTAYAEHNIVRARVQFKLVEQMETKAAEMQQIVADAVKQFRNNSN